MADPAVVGALRTLDEALGLELRDDLGDRRGSDALDLRESAQREGAVVVDRGEGGELARRVAGVGLLAQSTSQPSGAQSQSSSDLRLIERVGLGGSGAGHGRSLPGR